MNRNLVLIGTVAAFGFAAVVAGAGDSALAVACDETAKAAAVSSCCAKNGDAATASTKSAKVHGATVKSAVVAPGAAPILNAAAVGSALASNSDSDCSWCPEKCADAATAAAMGCTEYSAASLASCTKGAATTAAVNSGCASEASIQAAAITASAGCNKNAAVKTASAGCEKGAVTTAAAAGCDKSTATAAGSSSEKGFAVAAGGDACCKSGSAAATAAKEGKEVCDESKTATAFKGAVDELPYRENKRVVLTGAYVCGHCTLNVTDGCAPMFKTTDGKVYPLIKNAHASDLRTANTGKGIEIASSVKRIDGVKYLEVKSYKAF
ncbi:MAG TPA: hypothetical protein VFT13_11365 [Candidatus Krumholzibacteria bacterium]|nr:hypothetical protein [Candidatus Krumholzibacteria bacterium]